MSDADNAPSDPAEAGKRQADPTDMSNGKPQQTDEDVAQKPAEAINGFEGLYPRMTGQVWATVLSLRNGDVSAYRCKIDELQCFAADGNDCPDNKFNKKQETEENYMGSQVCDHLAAAIYQAPKTPDMDAVAMDGALSILEQAQEAADSAHNTAKTLQRARADHAIDTAENATQSEQSNGEPSDDELADRESVDPAEAAKRLQEAFDETVEGMETMNDSGKVWVNKTPQAPDYTFDAFLSGPDLMQYDPDGGPGEYYSNYVEPEDVDIYIAEVLQ